MTHRVLAIDQNLHLRLKNGDEQAFSTIYERYYRPLYSFIFAFLKHKQLTEEALQETFLAVWMQRATIREEYPIEPLLFLICRRKILDYFRKIASSTKLRAELHLLVAEINNETEEAISFNDTIKFTNDAIDKLPGQQQKVLRLSKIDGLSNEEIAQQLQLSKNTVKNHLAAALKTLRFHYQQHGMYYTFLTFTGFF